MTTTGDIGSFVVESYVINEPATLETSGLVTSLVELIIGLYHVLSGPTNSSEGFFAMETKQCGRCGEIKDVTAFRKSKRGKLGVRGECKSCQAVYDAARRSQRREQIAAYNADYRAAHRGEKTAYMAEYRAAHREEIAAYKATYYAAHREDSVAYRAAHREELAAYKAEWCRANLDKRRAAWHRYRARKLGNGGTHTTDDIKRQGEVQRWLCWWCLTPCEDKYHVDHIVPLAKGGHNDPSNLVISCPTCNLSKHDKLPGEWAGRLL